MPLDTRFDPAQKPRRRASSLIALFLWFILLSSAACSDSPALDESAHATYRSNTSQPSQTPTQNFKLSLKTATPSPVPVLVISPSATENPPVGPEYLPGYHPLTGLPVRDQAALLRNPLLVSITNFPPSARPQSGLSYAAQVWETSIGQGMTRFLALYYGDYLESLKEVQPSTSAGQTYDYVLGPIRSGRIAYEEIKQLYPDSKLIIRYASYQIVPRLSNIFVVDPANPEDVNSAGLTLEQVRSLTQDQVNPADYAGMVFRQGIPPNGQPGMDVEVVYNVLNRIRWEYDPGRSAYLRFQSEAFEGAPFQPAVDRLNGKQLSFENILILFAKHSFENLAASILDINLAYVSNHYGFLFRDGQFYPIKWSTTQGRLGIEDYQGNEIALKPGRTFVEVLSFESSFDKEQRLFRFHNPKLPTFTPVTPETSTPTLTETPGPPGPAPASSTPEETLTPSMSPTPTLTATPSPSPSQTP